MVFVSEEQPALCEVCSEANKTVTPNSKYPGNIWRDKSPTQKHMKVTMDNQNIHNAHSVTYGRAHHK
jgi:hypothetical protein